MKSPYSSIIVWKSRQKHDHWCFGKINIFSVKSTKLLKKLLKLYKGLIWRIFLVLFHKLSSVHQYFHEIFCKKSVKPIEIGTKVKSRFLSILWRVTTLLLRFSKKVTFTELLITINHRTVVCYLHIFSWYCFCK